MISFKMIRTILSYFLKRHKKRNERDEKRMDSFEIRRCVHIAVHNSPEI